MKRTTNKHWPHSWSYKLGRGLGLVLITGTAVKALWLIWSAPW